MAKIRVYVTLEEGIVEWVDDLIKRGVFHNRSHMVEQALKYIKRQGIKRILIERLEEVEH